MDLAALKERLRAEVQARAERLVELSHEIHEHPETNYEERYAHDLLTGVLEGEGLAVTRSARGVETAFEADARQGVVLADHCDTRPRLAGLGLRRDAGELGAASRASASSHTGWRRTTLPSCRPSRSRSSAAG